MANAASQKWENGVLVERAIETNRGNAGRREEVEATATKPYKTPVPTTHSPEEREALASVRQQQDVEREEAEAKAVLEAENKAVASATTKKPRKRAAKKK